MKFLKFLLLLLIFHHSTIICAQQYNFTHIDINDGLSHNQVNCFLKDSKGFMWFGTASGLNRYDGYNFKIFKNEPADSTTIGHNYILNLSEDAHGRIWVNTRLGLSIYNPATESFLPNPNKVFHEYKIPEGKITKVYVDRKKNYWFVSDNGIFKYSSSNNKTKVFRNDDNNGYSIASNAISDFVEDVNGNYWLVHSNGIIDKIDTKTEKVIYRNFDLNKQFGAHPTNYSIIADRDGDLWIYLVEQNLGVFYLNSSANEVIHFHKDAVGFKLNNNIIRGIIQDDKGLIWIGTDHGGINLFNKKNRTFQYILHDAYNEKSLTQNSIYSAYKDNTGIIWIGTFKKGINYYHENILKFQIYKHQSENRNNISYDVNSFAEDDKGNLWLGANGGGLIYFDRINNKFRQFLNDPDKPNQGLQSNVIVSLLFDSEKKLWIGTYFGGLYQFDGKTFTLYKHNPKKTSSVSSDKIWKIFEDSEKNFWIGTLGGGLDLFDKKKNVFYHYKAGDENSIHNNDISSIIEDIEGNLWIGTAHGIDVKEKSTGRFTHYLNDPTDPATISGNRIISLLQDSRGWIWIGTSEGLNVMGKDRKVFRIFKKEDGLVDNNILTVLEDHLGNLWLGTSKGLTNLVIKKASKTNLSFEIKNYNELDGLQGKVFNERAALKTRMNELIFGGVNGFNIFYPEDLKVNTILPQVVFTELEVFNEVIKPGEKVNGKEILKKSITETEEIVLNHNQNVFSIEFVALNFFHPEKNKYLYKLEGFNEHWVATDGNSRKITYTNLDPGTYTFLVKASNNDGFWNNKGKSLTITVLPPIWKTPIAFIIYLILIIALLFVARKMVIARARLKFQIEEERKEALRIHELDIMKMKFFTNISHEFRTPISLIISPLENILKSNKDEEQASKLQLVYRNAKRLLNLVNQLLDFRKLEVQQMKLNLSEGDIIQFLNETTDSFNLLSDKKNINFSFNSSTKEFHTVFDTDKLEKIVFNLLSNAFKFTPDGGKVSVEVAIHQEADLSNAKQKKLLLKVSDTGIGISAEKKEKIFERFYQDDLPMNLVNQGSGIGLALTKEFAIMMGATITVESELEKGSTFTLILPVVEKINLASTTDFIEQVETQETLKTQGASLQKIKKDLQKQNLLLVEDNEDFRFYLRENLKEHFNIFEAANGVQGLGHAFEEMPDIIISDVMMPEMNGLEFCNRIRNDARTSHIPVILLTARTAEEQKLEGYSNGAVDYITKPFNFEILLYRIKNLLAQRECFRKAFQKYINVKTSEVEIASLDEKLIKKCIEIVEANISNGAFSVEELSREIGMSRVHLYKKLLALTGKSPIEFIRTIRLQRAAQLLLKSQLTVSEISYQVGFNNPKYFARYFKGEYGVLPSQYHDTFRA